MASSFSLILILVAVIIAGLFIFSFNKKLPGYISRAKEYSEHMGFENSKNSRQLWLRTKWFGLGFIITLITLRFIFGIFIQLVLIIIEAVIVFILTQKKPENKAKKRIMYFLGTFSCLILYFLIILLLYSESKDTRIILFDFGIILILLITSIIGYSRNELLTTGETRCVQGNITNTSNYKYRFLFIPVINNVVYEYEFILNGITYKGSDGESTRQKKKRESELKNPVEIEYSITAPEKSRLTAIKHIGKTKIIILSIIVISIFVLHCIFFTDFLQTIKNFFVDLTQI